MGNFCDDFSTLGVYCKLSLTVLIYNASQFEKKRNDSFWISKIVTCTLNEILPENHGYGPYG